MIQDGQEVKFVNGGDPARIQRVQIANGRDRFRVPRVIPSAAGMEVQVVTGFDETRAPYINPLGDLSPAAWFRAGEGQTVTGSGVSQWSDQSGNARHLLQGTDSARPVSLLHEGTNYLYLPGVAGNYASTPDSAANSITGDIDIRVRVALADWTPSANNTIAGKYGASGNRSWFLQVNATTGALQLGWSADGTAVIQKSSTAAPTVSDGASIWLRFTLDVDNGAAGNDVKFYTAADSATEPTSWTQLGNTVTTAGTSSIFDSTAVVEVGSIVGGTGSLASGKLYRAIIKNGIDGTTVVDFDPSRASDSATSFVASTGETWTINSTGSLPAQIVGRSSVLFNGSAHYLKCNAFTLNQPTCVVMAVKQVSWTSGDYVCDGNAANTGLIAQVGSSPNLVYSAGTNVAFTGEDAIGSVTVLAATFNGAGSSGQVRLQSPATGNAGAGNMGGFTLGARADGAVQSNIQAYEVLILPVAPSTAQLDRIVRYMAGKYGVTL